MPAITWYRSCGRVFLNTPGNRFWLRSNWLFLQQYAFPSRMVSTPYPPTIRLHEALFCMIFGTFFNIKRALFAHQSPTLPQKIDSREGFFWCRAGVICECRKMNFYLTGVPVAPVLGLFSANCTAFWCKLHCVLVQIALRFGANYTAFWC